MLVLAIIWWAVFISICIGAMALAIASACGEAIGEKSIYQELEDFE